MRITVPILIRNIAIALVLVAMAVLYFNVEPAQTSWLPKCMFHELTGYDCPGCGIQRMLHSVLHLEFREAWGHNAFALLMLPVILFMGVVELGRKRWQGLYKKVYHPVVPISITVLILGWWVVRNL